MTDDKFDFHGAEDYAELTQRVLDRLDMIMAEMPSEYANKLMLAAAYLQQAHDLLDEAKAA